MCKVKGLGFRGCASRCQRLGRGLHALIALLSTVTTPSILQTASYIFRVWGLAFEACLTEALESPALVHCAFARDASAMHLQRQWCQILEPSTDQEAYEEKHMPP